MDLLAWEPIAGTHYRPIGKSGCWRGYPWSLEEAAIATVLGIRHGEVDNSGNVIYARLPGFRLSAKGRDGALSLAARLVTVPVRAVYASPLERAQETAEILSGPHGLDVITDDRLVEWSFWTAWQGEPWLTVRERAPEIFRAYADDPGSLCPEDPLERVGARMLEWSREAALAHPDGMVLGVSHEAPLISSYLVARSESISRFSAMHVGNLCAVRLQPAPAAILGTDDFP